eukprot:COSAG06_NODE_381_length_16594_cov_7.199454_2_plen_160_part_00
MTSELAVTREFAGVDGVLLSPRRGTAAVVPAAVVPVLTGWLSLASPAWATSTATYSRQQIGMPLRPNSCVIICVPRGACNDLDYIYMYVCGRGVQTLITVASHVVPRSLPLSLRPHRRRHERGAIHGRSDPSGRSGRIRNNSIPCSAQIDWHPNSAVGR